MEFECMLTANCTIGAGVTGGLVYIETAWLAVICMWIGSMIFVSVHVGCVLARTIAEANACQTE